MALDLPLDERGSEGHEGLVTKIVLRVAYREIEHVNFDNNVLDFEDGRRVFVGGDGTHEHTLAYLFINATKEKHTVRPSPQGQYPPNPE
jgi:hypothetical protein